VSSRKPFRVADRGAAVAKGSERRSLLLLRGADRCRYLVGPQAPPEALQLAPELGLDRGGGLVVAGFLAS
jgi:hypothetical protein